jgi:hypothetical protein
MRPRLDAAPFPCHHRSWRPQERGLRRSAFSQLANLKKSLVQDGKWPETLPAEMRDPHPTDPTAPAVSHNPEALPKVPNDGR